MHLTHDGAPSVCAQVLRWVAGTFPPAQHARVEEALPRLRDLRDGHIFRALGELAAPGTSLEQAARLSKVGDQKTWPLPPTHCCMHRVAACLPGLMSCVICCCISLRSVRCRKVPREWQHVSMLPTRAA